jgi:hypothetical protein
MIYNHPNRALRRIFEDENTGRWRKLHNEELHNLYSSQNLMKMIKSGGMEWVGNVARMREKSNAYSNMVGTSEGKRPLGII